MFSGLQRDGCSMDLQIRALGDSSVGCGIVALTSGSRGAKMLLFPPVNYHGDPTRELQ